MFGGVSWSRQNQFWDLLVHLGAGDSGAMASATCQKDSRRRVEDERPETRSWPVSILFTSTPSWATKFMASDWPFKMFIVEGAWYCQL